VGWGGVFLGAVDLSVDSLLCDVENPLVSKGKAQEVRTLKNVCWSFVSFSSTPFFLSFFLFFFFFFVSRMRNGISLPPICFGQTN
jgi:hypothetical protein